MKNIIRFVVALFTAILLGSLWSADPVAIGIVIAGLIYLGGRALTRRFSNK